MSASGIAPMRWAVEAVGAMVSGARIDLIGGDRIYRVSVEQAMEIRNRTVPRVP